MSKVCRTCKSTRAAKDHEVLVHLGKTYQAYRLRVCGECWAIMEAMLEQASVPIVGSSSWIAAYATGVKA